MQLEKFLLPRRKCRAVLALQGPNQASPGTEVAVEWETTPTVLKKKILWVRATFVFCRSFHTLKQLRQAVKESK